MYKFAVLFALVACSMAAPAPKPGFLGTSAAYHVAAAPVAVLPQSYSNTYNVAYKQPLVAAPAYTTYSAHAAPLTYAAPATSLAYAAHPAPLTYAAPLSYTAHPAPLSYAAHAAPLAYTSYIH